MTATNVFFFPNGNIAVTDENGKQVVEVQGSIYDYPYLRALARLIVRDKPEIHGFNPLVADYVAFYESRPGIGEMEEADALDPRNLDIKARRAQAWLEDRKRVVEAGDFAVMLLRGLFASPPNHTAPTLGQLEQAIRLWDRATGNI